jgi:hypothetical protein
MIHRFVQIGLGILTAMIPTNMAISAELIVQSYPSNVINATADGNDRNLPTNNHQRKPLKQYRFRKPIFTAPGRSKPFAGLINNQSTYSVNSPSQSVRLTDAPSQTTEGAGRVSADSQSPNQSMGASSGAQH